MQKLLHIQMIPSSLLNLMTSMSMKNILTMISKVWQPGFVKTINNNSKKEKIRGDTFGTSKRLCMVNGRQLNIQVDGTCLNCTTNYKYLGVTLDPSLNFDSHFNATHKKAAGRVNLHCRI